MQKQIMYTSSWRRSIINVFYTQRPEKNCTQFWLIYSFWHCLHSAHRMKREEKKTAHTKCWQVIEINTKWNHVNVNNVSTWIDFLINFKYPSQLLNDLFFALSRFFFIEILLWNRIFGNARSQIAPKIWQIREILRVEKNFNSMKMCEHCSLKTHRTLYIRF